MVRSGAIGLIAMTLGFLAAAGGLIGFLWWRVAAEQAGQVTFEQTPSGRAPARSVGTGLREDLEMYTRQINENPRDPAGYVGRGNTRYQMADFALAVEDYRAALEHGDQERSTFVSLAAAYLQLGDPDGALTAYSRLLDQSPDDLRALGQRAQLLRQEGRWEESAADFERLAEQQPSAGVFNALCWVQWGQGDYEGALESYNRSLDGRSPQSQDFLTRGAAHFYLRQYEQAQADLRMAAGRLGPSQDYSNYYLWLATTLLGQREDADAMLTEFIEHARAGEVGQWSPTVAAYLLGDITEEVFLDEAAQGYWLSVREQECEAYFYAGWKRLIEGDEETAARYFRRSIDTGQRNYYEYFGAQAALRQIRPDADTPDPE